MKSILKKYRLHAPDEMEKAILFRAQRNAYFFLIAALLAGSFYEGYRVYRYHTPLNPYPCFLLVAAVLIQIFSRLVITRNAVKGDEDSYETGPLKRLVLCVGITAGILLTAGAAVLLLGVKT